MADALDPADPADAVDRVDRLNPAASGRRRRGTAQPVGVASRAGRGAPGPRPHSPRPPRGPSPTAHAASRAGLTPVPVPTTVWTLPIPGDTVATANRPDTQQAAHTGLPDRIQRVLTAFAHPANTLILTGPGDDEPTGPGTAT